MRIDYFRRSRWLFRWLDVILMLYWCESMPDYDFRFHFVDYADADAFDFLRLLGSIAFIDFRHFDYFRYFLPMPLFLADFRFHFSSIFAILISIISSPGLSISLPIIFDFSMPLSIFLLTLMLRQFDAITALMPMFRYSRFFSCGAIFQDFSSSSDFIADWLCAISLDWWDFIFRLMHADDYVGPKPFLMLIISPVDADFLHFSLMRLCRFFFLS